jgi:hypothetical protein
MAPFVMALLLYPVKLYPVKLYPAKLYPVRRREDHLDERSFPPQWGPQPEAPTRRVRQWTSR